MSIKEKIVCVSGYFNPLHVGHLDYFIEAKKLGDKLIVVVNNDIQANLKYLRKPLFMNEKDRLKIVSSIKYVDEAVLSIDTTSDISATLAIIKPTIFCNGGDVNDVSKVHPKEIEICRKINCEILVGVGGISKVTSSSDLLSQYVKKFNTLSVLRMVKSGVK